MDKFMQKAQSYCCCAFLAGLLLSFNSACLGVELQVAQNENLPVEILKREIELQKLNDQLDLNAANPSFQRARRTWLWDYANALPTEGGLIAATALFHEHSSDVVSQTVQLKNEDGIVKLEPKLSDVHNHVPDAKVAGTIIPQIAGQVIGASGSLFELSADYSHSRRLHKLSLDFKAASHRVVALNEEITRMLQEYALQPTSNRESQRLEIEILSEIRSVAIKQFKNLESKALCNSVGRIIEDSVSLTRNLIGTVGNSINVAGIMRNSKRQNGRGSILNLVAASMITVRPLLSNSGSVLAKKFSYQRTRNIESGLYNSTLSESVEKLNRLCGEEGSDASLRLRVGTYKKQVDLFAEDQSLISDESHSMKQLALRRYRESIYGPTKIAQSTSSIVGNYRDLNNATVDNRLSAAANLTYSSGQVFNILELTRERIVDESSHARLKASGMLPEDRIKRNLERLSDIQKSLELKR